MHTLTARVLATSVVAAGVLMLSVAPVGADQGDPPVSGDDRATAYAGNITANKGGCAQAGLAGDVILQDDSPEGTSFDLPPIPEGFTLTGVVVKGGNAYNVYAGSSFTTGLHAPLNASGGPAGLSHWFACGTEEEETTSETTTTSEQTDSSEASTTTSAGGAVGSGAEGGLAETGASVGPALLVSCGLLLLGAGLVVATRRRAFGRN